VSLLYIVEEHFNDIEEAFHVKEEAFHIRGDGHLGSI